MNSCIGRVLSLWNVRYKIFQHTHSYLETFLLLKSNFNKLCLIKFVYSQVNSEEW